MVYIYDILLNWCKDKIYDFYEWEKTDKIDHIKKIPIFKIEKGLVDKITKNEAKIDQTFISNLFEVTEAYLPKKIVKIPYSCILTDGLSAIAIKCDRYGNVLNKSKMLIDEESEILYLSSKLKTIKFDYEINIKKEKEEFLTRKEIKIKNYILDEMDKCYKNNEIEKIKYLYTEYSNKKLNDVDEIYKEMLLGFKDGINESHYKIYDLLQLVSNKN